MAILKKSVRDVDVKHKKVIVRVDFNVPLDPETGEITDDKRIRGALPTLQYLLDQEAAIILVSHLGRPKKGPEAKFSMKPAAQRLAELLGRPVVLAADVVGDDARQKAQALKPGDILMLENVRFHKEETKNDPTFARSLAALAELYVNDAFGTAHRAHASTAGLAKFLPAVSGFLIQKELDFLGQALQDPPRPFVAILGGAKVSDKIGVIDKLMEEVDTLIIGGAMAYTFFAAQGKQIGSSLCEVDKIDLAKGLLDKAKAKNINLVLPCDTVITETFAADAPSQVVASGEVPDGWMGLDIGPKAVENFTRILKTAQTVVWNGPMGVFEFDAFATGTREVARAIAESDALSIIGGGDSAAAIEKLGFADRVTHISTGGGASLELLEGKVLPGIDALDNQNARRTLAAGNWKMNLGVPAQALDLVGALKAAVAQADAEIVLAVPFTVLPDVVKACAYTNLKVAAQNCHAEDQGAYTGEISAKMLAELGVSHVLIGHSERRACFGESDASVNRKTKAARQWGLRPIICCGESLELRETGETLPWIRQQILAALADIDAAQMPFITIAYEPIWAIGTGRVATAEQAQEVCAMIRQTIAERYDEAVAQQVRILYGGSVNAKNGSGLFNQADIDGALVGGASLKVDDFAAICLAGRA